MIGVIGIVIAGILFLLRVLVAWIADELLQRKKSAEVRSEVQQDRGFAFTGTMPARLAFETRLKNAAMAANEADRAGEIHPVHRALQL